MQGEKTYVVYMLASRPREGALYIGMTGHIQQRMVQNIDGEFGGAVWAKKYKCRFLVYVEVCAGYEEARAREMVLKGWKRAWKIRLIEEQNPLWRDLRVDLPVLLGLV